MSDHTDIATARPASEGEPSDTSTSAGHGHGHGHHGRIQMSPRARRTGLAVLIPAALLTLVALVWLWPHGSGAAQREQPGAAQRVAATVVSVHPSPCPPAESGAPVAPGFAACGTVRVRLSDGPDAGKEVSTAMPGGPGAPVVKAGDRVILMYLPDSPSDQPYQIIDHQRGLQLWALALAFAAAVIAFGRWRGLSALAGLAVSFAVLLLFVVPAILDGRPPLLVAIVGSAAIMLTVLYLTHGFTVTTSVAVLGTLASLALTGILAAVATGAAHLTGVSGEDSTYLNITYQHVNMRGLLLAGILIGSLGVLDDVAVTQAATVAELAHASPALTARQLYRAAGRVGRAHIASVINTIILAYAGASLPLLLLLAAGNRPLDEVLTNPNLAEEIVRSVVGTIGLIAAVPITTALAAVAATRGEGHRLSRGNISQAT
ncbi:MAG: YibE/F family protein [Dactylosporangium sp.]|nr:YibE/F family protein [Dactylosporangium sp.]